MKTEAILTIAACLGLVAAGFAFGTMSEIGVNQRLHQTVIHLQQNDPIYIQPHHRELLAGPPPEEGTIEELQWEMRADAIFRRMRAQILLGELE